MKKRHLSLLLSVFLSIVGLAGLTAVFPPATASAALGWVGGMFPAGGSSSSISQGGAFDVYVQAYKAGVTDSGGQGADITCTLYWSEVDSFGSWLSVVTTPMS